MANRKKQVPENVPGDFFVDSTCIDCDACRQISPEVFTETADGFSSVHHQPQNAIETRHALQALLACPTGSIGSLEKHDLGPARNDFPMHLENEIYYCGYNSQK